MIDLAPGLPSRIVQGISTDITERGPIKGGTVTFSLTQAILSVPDKTYLEKSSVVVPLDSAESGAWEVRLPTVGSHVEPADSWTITVKYSTRPFPFEIRVPQGNSPINIADIGEVHGVAPEHAGWVVTGLQIGTVTTGETAAARISGQAPTLTLDLTLPRGPRGEVGAGISILGTLDTTSGLPASGELGEAWIVGRNLHVWTGTEWLDAGPLQGETGPVGPPPAVTMDAVAVPATSAPTVERAGTDAAPHFTLGIPAGHDGAGITRIRQDTPTSMTVTVTGPDGPVDTPITLPEGSVTLTETDPGLWQATETGPHLVSATDGALPASVVARGVEDGIFLPAQVPDVILVAGQSNAAGNGHPVNAVTSPPHPLVKWWHTGADAHTGSVTPAVEPTARPYDGSAGVSPGVAFARLWADHYRRPVVVVPAAWGGTGLISGGARWSPAGDLHKAAVTHARDALAATGGRLAAIIWVQGENDAVSSVGGPGYADAATAALTAFRDALDAPDALIAVGSMVPQWVALGRGTAQAIQDALQTLPTRLDHCVFAFGGTGAEVDGIHYTAAGARGLARHWWDAHRRTTNPAMPPAAPHPPRLTPTETGVTATLTPTGGQMEVRHRTGTEWTTVAGPGPVQITAPSDVLVEAQARVAGGPWSASAFMAPILATATMLIDATGPGAAHGGPVTGQPLGGGRSTVQAAGVSPSMNRDTGGVTFSGSQFLASPPVTVTDMAGPTGNFTVMAACRATVPHDGGLFGWRNASASIADMGVTAGGEVFAQGFGASGGPVRATVATDVTRPMIVQMDRWGGGVTLQVGDGNPVSVSGVGPRTSGTAQAIIGAAYRSNPESSPVQYWRGNLTFLAVFPFAASAAQKTAVRRYIATLGLEA